MGFSVTLCNASKRPNSTFVPNTAEGVEYDCTLLDSCNITSPSIKFNFATANERNNAIKKNYCCIPAFNRYYFITEWESMQNCWIAHCTVDVLATYKNAIGESTQYVARASSRSNDYVLDTIYPTTGDVSVNMKSAYAQSLMASYKHGSYILGVINSLSYGVGSVCHYIISAENMRKIMGKLFNTVDWLNFDVNEISAELGKALFNPMQYIVSCKLIPAAYGGPLVNKSTFATPSVLEIGWWKFENIYEAKVILPDDTTIEETVTIEIPKHPQKNDRGRYLEFSPYSRYYLYLPFYGRIVLDPATLEGASSIEIGIEIDLLTGDCLYSIKNNMNPATIAKICTNVAVDIKMAQLTTDVLGTATSAINTIGNTASSIQSLDIGGTIASVANGIESTVKSAMPQLSTVGGVGSALQVLKPFELVGEFYKVVSEDKERRGRPLCESVKINTLNGYVKCADPQIGINNATSGEVDRIRDIMTEGFFYE